MAGTIVSTICANRVLDLPDTTADFETHPPAQTIGSSKLRIATFTTDLVVGLSAEAPDIYNWAAAMNDKPDGYAYIDIFSGDSDVRRVFPGLAAFADDLAEAQCR